MLASAFYLQLSRFFLVYKVLQPFNCRTQFEMNQICIQLVSENLECTEFGMYRIWNVPNLDFSKNVKIPIIPIPIPIIPILIKVDKAFYYGRMDNVSKVIKTTINCLFTPI